MKWLGLVAAIFLSLAITSKCEKNAEHPCFCQLKGELDDCTCTVESVDSFNNFKIYPRLASILQKDYFRYWKVNLQRQCPFWVDDSKCSLKDCHVDNCKEEQLPAGLKNDSGKKKENKYSQEANEASSGSCDENNTLGEVNTTLSQETKDAFKTWKLHDESQDTFCELDDESSADSHYVDLALNPERFTGYAGPSAARVWSSIYHENCFKPDEPEKPNYSNYRDSPTADLCLEKRVFYRLISGLHASINIHVCANYLFKDNNVYSGGRWGANVKEFQRRFGPELTNGEGPQRLRNLYFAYLVVLRAIAKAAPYLEKEHFYTGNTEQDDGVSKAVKDVLLSVRSFPDQFDESLLFRGNRDEAKLLKEAFKQHFRNISRIMDCVGCDKCRLWGKLQVTGIGTALKILFSGNSFGPESTIRQSDKKQDPPFQLRRQEIVALLNAFGRLSKSIQELELFRQQIKTDHSVH